MFRGEFTLRSILLPTLVTLLLLGLLMSLGFWQLDRANQKEALQVQFRQGFDLPVVNLHSLTLTDSVNRFRLVEAVGQYDEAHQILLDNQIVDGQVGVHVYTPLVLAGDSGRAILVNRGWLALAPGRQAIPPLPVDGGRQRVVGRVSQPANPGLRLGESVLSQWPVRLPYIDYQELTDVLPYTLLPAVLLLEPTADHGFARLWQPSFGGLGPQRHRGYAVQWFALALTLLVLYLLSLFGAWRNRPR